MTSLLIVRHGPGRGRLPGYLDEALGRLDAAVRRALVLHATGAAAPPDLAGVRAVVFWLADPLRELYPECFAEASAIETRARERGIALANPPCVLSNSIKSVQARLWRDAGIPTPACACFGDRAELEALLEHGAFPVLLKGDRLHAQQRMLFCRSREEVLALPDASISYPGVLTPFVDARAGWAARKPRSIWARFHHKKRLVVFGDRIQLRHVFFSEQPIVGLASSNLAPYRARGNWPGRPVPAWLRMPKWERAAIRAERRYFGGRCEAPELMRRAARALGFDNVAIDYASLADGGVMLWEANPYQYVPGSAEAMLPKLRRFEARYAAFCRALSRYFAELLDGREPTPPPRVATNSA
jgi:hypothetical protein